MVRQFTRRGGPAWQLALADVFLDPAACTPAVWLIEQEKLTLRFMLFECVGISPGAPTHTNVQTEGCLCDKQRDEQSRASVAKEATSPIVPHEAEIIGLLRSSPYGEIPNRR